MSARKCRHQSEDKLVLYVLEIKSITKNATLLKREVLLSLYKEFDFSLYFPRTFTKSSTVVVIYADARFSSKIPSFLFLLSV